MVKFIVLIAFIVSSIQYLALGQNVDFKAKHFKGQTTGLKNAKKAIKQGDKEFKRKGENFDKAINYYLRANKFNPDNSELNYKIGVCYLSIEQTTEAIRYLERARNLDPNLNRNLYFQLASAYQYSLQFEKSIEYFEHFSKILEKKEFAVMYEEIQKRIKQCELGKELSEKPIRSYIDNLGKTINTQYPEYAPIINADESILFFSSRRPTTTGKKMDKVDGLYFEDIYFSEKKGNQWKRPKNPGTPLNTETHDAIVGMAPDGQTLLIYRAINGGDIFEAKKEGKKWGEPRQMPSQINSKYHESSASYSFDGRTIFFDSNRPGGYGGHDIYMSKRDENGNWSEAKNLGPNINTSGDEESVFIHPDGKTLYFSSNGHRTLGSYDIFKAIYKNDEWPLPENLGFPINTPDEDKYFSMGASGRRGYYSSAKADCYGSTDIYQVIFLGTEKETVNNTEDQLLAYNSDVFDETIDIEVEVSADEIASKLTLVKGVILDHNNMPVKATIEIIDNSTGEIIATFESNSESGKYLLSLPSGKNYGMNVKAEDFLFHSENFDVDDETGFNNVELNIELQEKKTGASIALRNIFYEVGKWQIKKESQAELERVVKLLEQNPTMELEVSGHTDNVGSSNFNKNLSEKRAKAIFDMLAKRGVDIKRITYKGYGFSKPIASNNTEDGRQKNRRTEITILKE